MAVDHSQPRMGAVEIMNFLESDDLEEQDKPSTSLPSTPLPSTTSKWHD